MNRMMNNALVVKELTVRLDDFELKDIDFELPQGAILGLVGKNGAGKTTLIKSICGIYPRIFGNVHFNGFDIYSNEKDYLSQIGVLPDYQWVNMLFKPVSIAKLLKKSYPQFNESFYFEKLEQFDISKNKRVGKLSLGML